MTPPTRTCKTPAEAPAEPSSEVNGSHGPSEEKPIATGAPACAAVENVVLNPARDEDVDEAIAAIAAWDEKLIESQSRGRQLRTVTRGCVKINHRCRDDNFGEITTGRGETLSARTHGRRHQESLVPLTLRRHRCRRCRLHWFLRRKEPPRPRA